MTNRIAMKKFLLHFLLLGALFSVTVALRVEEEELLFVKPANFRSPFTISRRTP